MIIAITAAGSASAHGDPASHYLETDALYPSFARQPSVEVQLQLLGLLQAAERRGYPIKVALVAGVEDLVDDLAMMRAPQRYAGMAMIDRELARRLVLPPRPRTPNSAASSPDPQRPRRLVALEPAAAA